MTFYIEAHPQGFSQFAVPVIEGPNATPTEHSLALNTAAEEAGRRFRVEHSSEKIGPAIVFACHKDPEVVQPVHAHNSVIGA